MNVLHLPGEELRLAGVSVYAAPDSGDPVPVLEDVNLTLRPGEWVNLVGVNGSGKSTLARLLAGLHVEGASGTAVRGFAGLSASPIVLQRPEAQLFGETPREEIQFALEWRQIPPEHIASRVEGVLMATGLSALADRRWDLLSGGQRQLAAVAAASAVETPLIVFDEATSMLDEGNRQAVMELARGLWRQGAAVVWVTQRLEELAPQDRTIAVAEGRIVSDGDARRFFYDRSEGQPPCVRCGLRLPYLAALALELERRDRLRDPLPLTEKEWREVRIRAAGG